MPCNRSNPSQAWVGSIAPSRPAMTRDSSEFIREGFLKPPLVLLILLIAVAPDLKSGLAGFASCHRVFIDPGVSADEDIRSNVGSCFGWSLPSIVGAIRSFRVGMTTPNA